ncbi:metal-dependent hydrolase [Fervidibacillus halotolerans]|uniref:UPF0173 metal-dependent hydrolase OE105_08585 n=1 Tax=Fervidibacillus halotolerans TaxID=2980027 RepID=A0A9E8LYC9_9BACI|nr:metal-dependent hydrolase [Fervidibacillus halotolerans]WAA11677.1 metal-dependent hydrolase [Fervidibacillus halotolerans]
MKITYHGHAVVKIQTKGKEILIDPFITGNGLTDLKVEKEQPDYIIVTHGHGDHLGDTVQLAKKKNALVISMVELAQFLASQGVNSHGMNIGGSYDFDFGTVKLTPALHSTGYENGEGGFHYLGTAAGVLLTIEGKRIYHAGDTALFSDMELIGKDPIDIAFLPIGDNFTMGPEDAAYAAKLLKAKYVVPIHYNTFPVIEQDPNDFIQRLDTGIGKILEPGEGMEL